jgi:hypothetical protein
MRLPVHRCPGPGCDAVQMDNERIRRAIIPSRNRFLDGFEIRPLRREIYNWVGAFPCIMETLAIGQFDLLQNLQTQLLLAIPTRLPLALCPIVFFSSPALILTMMSIEETLL